MLRLSNYLLRSFPNPPPSADYSPKAMSVLNDIYGNDICGDCTCAAAYHIAGGLLANSNQPNPFNDQSVMTLYKQLSGWNGVPDDSSDSGLTEQQVFNVWAQQGLQPGDHQITGFVELDPKDPGEVMAAIWLFENVYRAAQLPQAWIDGMDSMQNGFTWNDVGAPTDEGHAWMGCGYDSTGIKIDTWAMLGTETYASIAAYGHVYTVLGVDSIDRASQKAPNGFNWTQLLSDLESLGPIQT